MYYIVIVITACPLRHALKMTNFSARLDICRHRRRVDEPPLIPPRATSADVYRRGDHGIIVRGGGGDEAKAVC